MRGAAGLTLYRERRVLLSYADAKHRNAEARGWGAVDTLLHELVHVRCGKGLRHGAEFRQLENSLWSKLGCALMHNDCVTCAEAPQARAADAGDPPQARRTRGRQRGAGDGPEKPAAR
jgi:hypothetical protein